MNRRQEPKFSLYFYGYSIETTNAQADVVMFWKQYSSMRKFGMFCKHKTAASILFLNFDMNSITNLVNSIQKYGLSMINLKHLNQKWRTTNYGGAKRGWQLCKI